MYVYVSTGVQRWRSCAEEVWRLCLLCIQLSGTCRASGSWRVLNTSFPGNISSETLYACYYFKTFRVDLLLLLCVNICSMDFLSQALRRFASEGSLQPVAAALPATRRERLCFCRAHLCHPLCGPADPDVQGGRPRRHPVPQLCAH